MSQIRFDTHIHSRYSVDSDADVAEIYSFACKSGLKAISITDHYDLDMIYSGCDEQVLTDGYSAISKWRSDTENSDTQLLCGIELGASIFEPCLAEKIINEHNYDIVISSLHGLKGHNEYYLYKFGEMSDFEIRATIEEYFSYLLKQVRQGYFDTLAHLDYPTRYIRRMGIDFDISYHYDVVDEILKALANSGKALEINTSGLFDVFNCTMPNSDVVKRFKMLGGEYITIGSDAHIPDRVGAHFDTALSIAKNAGFDYVTYYKSRKPVMVKIDI